MLRGILATALIAVTLPSHAADLPTGEYAPYFYGWDGSPTYWLAGDISIQEGNRYAFQNESGRYEVNGDHVNFDGGALDGAFAVIRQSDGQSAIVLPRKENEERGKKFAVSDIWAYRKNE